MRLELRRFWLLGLCMLLGGVVCDAAWADGPESGLWWSPSLRITGVVDDNLFTTKTNTNGDVGFWIAPRVEAAAVDLPPDVHALRSSH